jgi:hypothetical protein
MSGLIEAIKKQGKVITSVQSEAKRRSEYNHKIVELMSATNRLNFEEQKRRDEFNRKYQDYTLIEEQK